ncbi:hypothetical protein FRAHR75_270013 [Frankia sp. Hr75.2]|nr:hypothetical protein FRAHR75_270013 [Frankia sp. Hr75.2]
MRPRRVRPPAPTSEFAGFRFPPEVIVLAVRRYLRLPCRRGPGEEPDRGRSRPFESPAPAAAAVRQHHGAAGMPADRPSSTPPYVDTRGPGGSHRMTPTVGAAATAAPTTIHRR